MKLLACFFVFHGLLAVALSAPEFRFEEESVEPTPIRGPKGWRLLPLPQAQVDDSFEDVPALPETSYESLVQVEDLPLPRGISNETEPSTRQTDLCQCGQSSVGRIVGGTAASQGEFPWRVSLTVVVGRSSFQCAGTILTSRLVLTAAHCFGNDSKKVSAVQVYAGDTNRRRAKRYDASAIQPHESYNPKSHLHDIGLIQIRTEFPFGSRISPACLPYKFVNQTDTRGKVVGSGWGTTTEKGSSTDNLLKVELDLITNADCKSMGVQPTQVCTYTSKKDTCQGDSGGSIDKIEGKSYAFGVVSYGVGCAREGYPGVYTRISQYTKWIEDTTGVTNFCKS